MDNTELPEQEVSSKQKADEQESKRNILPIYTLGEILNFSAKIYTLGYGSYHSKELIAETLNTQYNSIKQKLSAAQQYGLLELKHRVGYKLTPLFLKIQKPINDKEKREGVIEALRSSDIYNTLIEEFNGHPLPPEQGLAARLLRTFGIKDYAALRAAQVFVSNIRENGLESNDMVNASLHHISPKTEKPESSQDKPAAQTPKADIPLPGYIEIPIPLQGGKRAYIKIPEDYKPEDCERIAKFVEALK